MRKFYLPFFVVLVIALCFIPKCNHPEPSQPTKVFDSIPYFKAKIDSLSTYITVEYLDRVEYRTRFKTVRHDSLIPCETKLLTCDTLILKDDSLINDLLVKDTVNTRFNMYLVNRIKTDSIVLSDTCKYFGKQIRKHKIQKWLIIAGGVIGVIGAAR